MALRLHLYSDYLHSPACQMTPDVSLDGNGTLPHPQILPAGQPAADGLLDADTSQAQLVRPQLFHVGDLTSPEEDLVLSKLVLVLVL